MFVPFRTNWEGTFQWEAANSGLNIPFSGEFFGVDPLCMAESEAICNITCITWGLLK